MAEDEKTVSVVSSGVAENIARLTAVAGLASAAVHEFEERRIIKNKTMRELKAALAALRPIGRCV